MKWLVEALNLGGARAVSFAWPMLWQSSVLIGLVLVLDLLLRNKVRAAVRYALWAVVLVKLVLPPGLALPTGLGWWLRPAKPAPQPEVYVTYGPATLPIVEPTEAPRRMTVVQPAVSGAGWTLVGASLGSLALMSWMVLRWRRVATLSSSASIPPVWLSELLEELRSQAGSGRKVRLRLIESAVSPAVFGLWQPVILLPGALVHQLSVQQLRAVLLHELTHLRRGDVWVNCAQALLQVIYWWHPLLWLANSRMRRAREEAVDDAVMLVLRGDAETYAPTLLEVARFASHQPMASLGILGILESRSSLRLRIERLINFKPPGTAGLTLASALCVTAFGAMALPLGNAPVSASVDRVSNPEIVRASFETRAIVVDTNKFTMARGGADLKQLKAHLESLGVDLKPPKSIFYTESIHALMVTASSKDLGIIEQTAGFSTPARRAAALVQEGKLFYEMGQSEQAQKKLMEALREDPESKAAIYYLNLIKESRRNLDSAQGRLGIYARLDRLKLERVVFAGVPLSEVAKSLTAETQRIDPEGEGVLFFISRGTAGIDQEDIGRVTIRLAHPIEHARVVDILDAIVRAAERPIKYSLENYGVSFSFKGAETQPLYVRMIKVDPATLESGLHAAVGGSSKSAQNNTASLLRQFLASAQVDLSPPKSIFYNEREGTIVVRATLPDLDMVESAIASIHAAPAQLNIRAKFMEVTQAEANAFWGNLSNVGRSKGPNGEQPFWSALLTGDQASAQIKQWKSAGATVLAEPSVTTLSGRQAEVLIGEPKMIVTNPASVGGQTNEITTGLSLKLLPLAEGTSIRLALTAAATEFLGYEKEPGSDIPLPQIRKREFSVTQVVPDGTTLVLGGDPEDAPEAKAGENKQLLIFVTPTLIDQAGNRLHPDDGPRPKKSGGLEGPVRAWYPTVPPRPVKE